MQRTIKINLNPTEKKKKEILLQRYLVGAIKPPRLENLNSKSCESYKQPIQEQNIKMATRGESFNSSHY